MVSPAVMVPQSQWTYQDLHISKQVLPRHNLLPIKTYDIHVIALAPWSSIPNNRAITHRITTMASLEGKVVRLISPFNQRLSQT